MGWKGNRTPSNPQEGYYVGLMNACGYRTKDLEKPVIGIVNSFTDVNPGHRAFKELVGYVKEGVWAAGGTPAEFNVPAPCDGMAQGEGMHFILPSRDLIAGSIEAMVSAHGFDGLVFLCSCDKIVPGMLMAAAALNKPCMFLTAGSMLPYEADEGTYVTPDLKESIGQRNIDAISEETFTRFRENICFSCGTCSMYGTANTMGVFAEVIGLCPIDSTTMLFCSSAKYKQARDVGERIVTLTKEGVCFSDIVTEASLENGLRHAAGIGKAARVAAGIGRQLLLVLGQKRLVHALGRKDAERFLKCEHEVHVAAHALAPRLELFRVARADEHDLAVRVVALDHARGEHHGREGHGNVFLKLREEFFDHVAPRRAAGCDHELVLFGHFLQKVRRLLDHAQVCTDGDLVYVGKAQTLERLAHPLGHALGAELPHERRRERHVHGGVAFDGLNGLEDLALVRDRTERAADHALAAGGALGVVDVGAAEPVGMDAVHAAGLAARALETHDGVELALFQAAPAADALIRVDVGLTVLPRDGLPRADGHARVLQTALAYVRDLHNVVRAAVARELDDVDERLFVIDIRVERLFHAVR